MRPLPLLFALTLPGLLAAQASPLSTPEAWQFSGSLGEIVAIDGDPVMRLTGNAALSSLDFRDGTIRFEIRLTEEPAFVGFQFRRDAAGGNAEHIYFRPHKSGEWDAIQYQPIQNGSSTWQLHAGEGFSGEADFPGADRWMPVRLEVRGREAELFLGDASREPTMVIHLEGNSDRGPISFAAGFRDDAPADAVAAMIRRVVVADRTPAPPRAEAPVPPDDLLRTWKVGTPVAVGPGAIRQIPANNDPIEVLATRRGVVNLNAHFARVAGADRSAAVAETILESDADREVALAFDFSDDIAVFLDGRLLYTGSNGWQSRYPLYLGVVRPEALTNTVWLPLARGAHRLTMVVADASFGWGFAARLGATDGVRVVLP